MQLEKKKHFDRIVFRSVAAVKFNWILELALSS